MRRAITDVIGHALETQCIVGGGPDPGAGQWFIDVALPRAEAAGCFLLKFRCRWVLVTCHPGYEQHPQAHNFARVAAS